MNLRELSDKRIKDAEVKYKDDWKALTKKDILRNIREELADTISYLTFYEKSFNKNAENYKTKIQNLYDEIEVRLMQEDKNVSLKSFTVG